MGSSCGGWLIPSQGFTVPASIATHLPAVPIQARVGFFGTGSRLHVYVGNPSVGWWSLCGGVSWKWNRKNPDYEGDEFKRVAAPDGSRADCWRCAKAAGLVERYPGPEERRRIELERRHHG